MALGVGLVQGMIHRANMQPAPIVPAQAAIMRAGLNEMRRLSKALYPEVQDNTFFESCGVADLVATSLGGRNRLVGAAFVEAHLAGRPESFEQLEVGLRWIKGLGGS